MALVEYANTILSNAFRICSFLFLRVLPHHLGEIILPALYLGYLATWLLLPAPASFDVVVDEKPVKAEEKAEPNGNGAAEHKTEPSITARPKEPDSIRSILLGLPTPVKRQRLLNLAINTLFLLAAVDLTFAPYFDPAHDVTFTRVGAVYPDGAKIVVRYPPPKAPKASLPAAAGNNTASDIVDAVDERLNEVRVQWRQVPTALSASPDASAGWKDGPIVSLAAEHDWVATARLSGLYPSTIYEYRLAHLNGTARAYPPLPVAFRTFPDPRYPAGSHFRFVVSSCVKPNFPYMPFQGRTIKGFDLLADYLWPKRPATSAPPTKVDAEVADPLEEASAIVDEMLSDLKTSASSLSSTVATEASTTQASTVSSEKPTSTAVAPSSPVATPPPATEFMLFLGDFIYADVPLYFGDDKEAYRRLYRRNYNSPSFRKVYEQLPIFHVYDDHEFINNFAGEANFSAPPFPNASDAYDLYNHQANYDASTSSVVKGPGKNYYDFRYADVAFFVMDTRAYRTDPEHSEPEERTMLGDEQLTALYDWLAKVNGTATFKFIVSSVPFTSLWTYEAQTDSWAGFPSEKAALLSVLHTVPNIVVLSGDRHEFGAIQFNPEHDAPGQHPVLEISTSPLSMFYVPLVRTLKPRSEATVKRFRTVMNTTAEGEEVVQTVEETVPKEVVLKYIPVGNYKWSAIEVDTRDLDHPVVKLEMVADGRPAYHLEIKGTPVKLGWSTAIGAFVPQSFKGVLDKIGLKPSKWF